MSSTTSAATWSASAPADGAGGAAEPDLVESAKRNAYMLLNLIPWLGGLLWFIAAIGIAVTVSSSPSKQGWHDKFAGGTQLVKD
ncbi:RDD family protein [Nocardia sp. NPDC057272]|uniref:RDD family protein n=1 Tax=Nocardia sp. NPDC057272 TaxID=3346079 RepID=UPI00362E9B50